MTRRRSFRFVVIALCLAAALAPLSPAAEQAAATNKVPVALNLPGLPNAFKVSDTLYRGAQPDADGIKELTKLGIKTVVCLRSFHSDKKIIEDSGLKYEEIPINTWDIKEEQVVRFLQIVTDTNRTPVFVHCQHGADRTGTMCAVYRMAVCGWTREDAIKEMTTGGFGFHKTWQNLIDFLNKIDIESIKTKASQTVKEEKK